MGKIKNNTVTKGFSGKFGDDILFRQVDNKTVFSKRTLVTSAPTPGQVAVRNKFTEASLFASAAIDNPQAGQDYKVMAEVLGLKSAYIAAVTDFLTEPEIGSVFTKSYKGKVGDLFNIKAKMPYKITEVEVSILRADGSVVESGSAVPSELKWRYTAKVANPQVAGCKLVLVGRDRQERETTFERLL